MANIGPLPRASPDTDTGVETVAGVECSISGLDAGNSGSAINGVGMASVGAETAGRDGAGVDGFRIGAAACPHRYTKRCRRGDSVYYNGRGRCQNSRINTSSASHAN